MSGVSSDVEGEYGVKSDRKVHQMPEESKHVHNSSQIVSEKMANLREVMRASSEATPQVGHHLNKSVAPTGGQIRGTGQSGSICCAAPATQQSQHYSHQTRRTASVCEDQHKVRHNSPSGHSVPLQTTTSQTPIAVKSVPNAGPKQTYSTSIGERTGQPKAVLSVGADSSRPNSQSNANQPIRLQIDSLGNLFCDKIMSQ